MSESISLEQFQAIAENAEVTDEQAFVAFSKLEITSETDIDAAIAILEKHRSRLAAILGLMFRP